MTIRYDLDGAPATIDLVQSARQILSSLGDDVSLQTKRELVEAVLGLRAARLQVSENGINALDAMSRNFGFGASVADFKIVCGPTGNHGNWTDVINHYLPLSDRRGDFVVYIASSQCLADHAREADAEGDDETVGECFGIPRCCREAFIEWRERGVGDLLTECLRAWPPDELVSIGANVVAQYFDGGFLSHYPCSLRCRSSAQVAFRRYRTIADVDPRLATRLAAPARRSYVVRPAGIVPLGSSDEPFGAIRGQAERIPVGFNSYELGRDVFVVHVSNAWIL